MTLRRVVAPLAAAAALAGAAGAPAGAATPRDPCGVVSRADAVTALGAPVTRTTSTTMGPSRSCVFHGSRPGQSVVVTAFRSDSLAEARSRFADLVKQSASVSSSAPAKLPGVGDEAVVVASTVYARKGTEAYVFNVVNVHGARSSAVTARAERLAKATLARIR
jgi:hypothetical protein